MRAGRVGCARFFCLLFSVDHGIRAYRSPIAYSEELGSLISR